MRPPLQSQPTRRLMTASVRAGYGPGREGAAHHPLPALVAGAGVVAVDPLLHHLLVVEVDTFIEHLGDDVGRSRTVRRIRGPRPHLDEVLPCRIEVHIKQLSGETASLRGASKPLGEQNLCLVVPLVVADRLGGDPGGHENPDSLRAPAQRVAVGAPHGETADRFGQQPGVLGSDPSSTTPEEASLHPATSTSRAPARRPPSGSSAASSATSRHGAGRGPARKP